MKKFLFTIAAIAFGMSQASAQTISFGPLNDEGYIEVPQGGQATVAAQYTKESTTIVKGYKFTLTFQDKYVNTVKDKNNLPVFNLDSDNDAFAVQRTENNGFSAIPAASSASLKGTEGSFGTLIFEATADAEIGSTHLVKVSNAGFTIDVDGALKTQLVEDFTFTVKIVDNRITLDENSTTAPEAAENVNVLVKRSVKAGNWGTICLPFAMTEDQVKAVFGDGAKLADLDGTDLVKDTEGLISEIKVKFVTATSIAANHPYLLKSENDITYEDGFKVDGVNIKATSDPQVGKDLVYDEDEDADVPNSFFYGTYVPIVLDKATYLFLSGNKFYYSNKETKMKGFRGYFKLQKALAAKYKDLSTGAHIGIVIDDEATSIEGFTTSHVVEGVYDLSGRKIQLENGDLNKLQKGVYIIDGKKVTIK